MLRLTLAPEVVVNSQKELIGLIDSYVRGFVVGAEASLGDGNNITAERLSVEIKNGKYSCDHQYV